METQDKKNVIEIEGVKLSAKTIAKIFYLQHCFHKESKGIELNFNNESANSDIHFINESIHFLLDISKQDLKLEQDFLNVLWCLNDYKKLLDALKSPEENN
jgi:hypothetical protein